MGPLIISPRQSPERMHEPSTHDDTGTQQTHTSQLHRDSFIVEIFKFSILALVIVVPFRLFIAQPFIVSGASMYPTFDTGQYLIVDQLTYHFEQPQRGDVIIFKFPQDPSKYFIKRIIGLPGETVELDSGVTRVTNPTTNQTVTLNESYLKTDRTGEKLTRTLASNEYFVMGDNRGASSDSRIWGPVPRENIMGRALIRLLPPSIFGIFPGSITQQELVSQQPSHG